MLQNVVFLKHNFLSNFIKNNWNNNGRLYSIPYNQGWLQISWAATQNINVSDQDLSVWNNSTELFSDSWMQTIHVHLTNCYTWGISWWWLSISHYSKIRPLLAVNMSTGSSTHQLFATRFSGWIWLSNYRNDLVYSETGRFPNDSFKFRIVQRLTKELAHTDPSSSITSCGSGAVNIIKSRCWRAP